MPQPFTSGNFASATRGGQTNAEPDYSMVIPGTYNELTGIGCPRIRAMATALWAGLNAAYGTRTSIVRWNDGNTPVGCTVGGQRITSVEGPGLLNAAGAVIGFYTPSEIMRLKGGDKAALVYLP